MDKIILKQIKMYSDIKSYLNYIYGFTDGILLGCGISFGITLLILNTNKKKFFKKNTQNYGD